MTSPAAHPEQRAQREQDAQGSRESSDRPLLARRQAALASRWWFISGVLGGAEQINSQPPVRTSQPAYCKRKLAHPIPRAEGVDLPATALGRPLAVWRLTALPLLPAPVRFPASRAECLVFYFWAQAMHGSAAALGTGGAGVPAATDSSPPGSGALLCNRLPAAGPRALPLRRGACQQQIIQPQHRLVACSCSAQNASPWTQAAP